MLIPLRTDRDPRRRPIVTQGLILINALVFLTGLAAHASDSIDIRAFTNFMSFDPQDFRAWQLVTCMFMHDPQGIWHILFNMLFLWVFGGPVEDRFGRVGFLLFYIGGGVVAALAHMVVSDAPVIGASGAIAAVTGAFLALFPRSNIIVFWLFTLTVMPISSLWLIGLYFAIDVLRQFGEFMGMHGGRVAYMAHIAGYMYGFGVAFALLGFRIIKREEFDVFFLFTQMRRRAAFRAAMRGTPAGAWESASADTGARLAARAAKPLSPEQMRLADLRAQVNALALHDLPAAAHSYRKLLQSDAEAVFAEPRQLELANQLCAQQDHAHAAAAYELLLGRYPASSKAPEVRLMLGLLYARHLNRPQQARELIQAARPHLHDQQQLALADQLLSELGA